MIKGIEALNSDCTGVILVPSLGSCVTLGKSLPSKLKFLIHKMGVILLVVDKWH